MRTVKVTKVRRGPYQAQYEDIFGNGDTVKEAICQVTMKLEVQEYRREDFIFEGPGRQRRCWVGKRLRLAG